MSEKKMLLNLRTYRCGDPRQIDEGLRIGAVRFLPRGIRKEEYSEKNYFDVWLPTVAPSREALRYFKNKDISRTWGQFAERYISEMSRSSDSRQTIILLAEMASRMPISIGCYCREESLCHRLILRKLIEKAYNGSLYKISNNK